MRFKEAFDRIAWGALLIIAVWVGTEIQGMSKSVAELNTNIAVIINTQGFHKEQLMNHELRIHTIERNFKPKEREDE